MKPRLLLVLVPLLTFCAAIAWWLSHFPNQSDSSAAGDAAKNGAAGESSSAKDAGGAQTKLASEQYKTALLQALDQPAGPHRLAQAMAAFGQWVKAYPNDAMTWGEDSFEGKERLAAMKLGIGEWAAKDPSAAAAWVDGMAGDPS